METLKKGTLVISWDFESYPDRPDRYIIGYIRKVDRKKGCYHITVKFDSTDEGRKHVVTPMNMLFSEFDGRIKAL